MNVNLFGATAVGIPGMSVTCTFYVLNGVQTFLTLRVTVTEPLKSGMAIEGWLKLAMSNDFGQGYFSGSTNFFTMLLL